MHPNEVKISDRVWNVPNALSLVRLALALLVGALIEGAAYLPALIFFCIAAATDWIDGWWARKYNCVTKFGRILDPFVDKVIIAAALIALVGVAGSCIQAWMVTLIVAREFLVTSIRAMVEGRGGDFSARSLGKWKMVLQCGAVISSLVLLSSTSWGSSLIWVTSAMAWAAVLLTIVSGADYVLQALRISRAA